MVNQQLLDRPPLKADRNMSRRIPPPGQTDLDNTKKNLIYFIDSHKTIHVVEHHSCQGRPRKTSTETSELAESYTFMLTSFMWTGSNTLPSLECTKVLSTVRWAGNATHNILPKAQQIRPMQPCSGQDLVLHYITRPRFFVCPVSKSFLVYVPDTDYLTQNSSYVYVIN